MPTLKESYNILSSILGKNIESYESVKLIEQYRQYFKPANVRVILLAESHVFTSDEDRKVKTIATTELSSYPSEFARFVYCLAYGENDLIESSNDLKNSGSPQFWKILLSCCQAINDRDDFYKVLKKETSFDERIKNKLDIIKTLKDAGVWLVDASVVALYQGGGASPSRSKKEKAIRESWNAYTKDVVLSAKPNHLICIGKGVAGVIKKDLNTYFPATHTILDQPNARLSFQAHLENFKAYSNICMSHDR